VGKLVILGNTQFQDLYPVLPQSIENRMSFIWKVALAPCIPVALYRWLKQADESVPRSLRLQETIQMRDE
jgi:hypothetical protein